MNIFRLQHTLRSWKHSLLNRFVRKYYRIDLRQMPKTAWWDTDKRLFHAAFQLFEDFLLKEVAAQALDMWKYDRRYGKLPTHQAELLYERSAWIKRHVYNREILLAFMHKHYEWECALTSDPDYSSEAEKEALQRQSARAHQIYCLANWWLYKYPIRTQQLNEPDSLMNAYVDHFIDNLNNPTEITDPKLLEGERRLSARSAADAQWNEEKTEMLIRLCKLRSFCWT